MGWDAKSKIIGGIIKVIVAWIYHTVKGARKHGGFKEPSQSLDINVYGDDDWANPEEVD